MKKRFVLLSIILACLPAAARATVSEGWERHVVSDQAKPIYLYVADMDGDGDLDIVSTTADHPNNYISEVAWFQNNLNTGGDWNKYIICSRDGTSTINAANGVVVADIDSDGHPDVIVATGRVTVAAGSVYWFKAPEDPTQENWQKFQVEPATDTSFFKIYTMDVNKDRKQDIIAGTNAGTYVYLNPGNPTVDGAQWERLPLGEGTGSSNYLADMNCDGKLEILNTQRGIKPDYIGSVSFFKVENKAGETTFAKTLIDDSLVQAFDINAMDANNDRRKDVVVSVFMTPGLYWYAAPLLSSQPWTKHAISDTFEGTDMYTGDINGDRKSELIVSGLFQNKISWFAPSSSDEDALWTENVLDDNITLPGDISLNDLDGDGDLDVVLAGLGENQIIWYENKTSKKNACVLTYLLGEKSSALQPLRKVRDMVKRSMPGGEGLVDAYYAYSPVLIESIKTFKSILRTS